jgi:hypothetical protein
MKTALVLLIGAVVMHSNALAKDWYIAPNDSGRDGTRAQPAKDLGIVSSQLQAGDRVFIAAGTYLGRGDNGADRIIVPVEIQGGWSADFRTRDPWRTLRTVFSGSNTSDNFSTDTRLSISTEEYSTTLSPKPHRVIVEGIIFDNAARNTYANSSSQKIIRKGTGVTRPTPESGGLSISTGVQGNIFVRNNIVMNTAPTMGAFSFFPGKGASVTIQNNSAVNNTGVGFHLSKSYFSENIADQPNYIFENNVAVFTQKYDPFATFGGSAIMLEAGTKGTIKGSVFALSDFYAIDNARRAKGFNISKNFFMGNVVADYLEFNTKIKFKDLSDLPEMCRFEDNASRILKLPISSAWAGVYNSRNIIDRAAVEGATGGLNTSLNDLRGALGLPLQGGAVSADSDVWLPRISWEDAKAVSARYGGQFGVFTPNYP